jgi:two-component system, chemotaxis family, protein-glutamate methylesterase/glutaminase
MQSNGNRRSTELCTYPDSRPLNSLQHHGQLRKLVLTRQVVLVSAPFRIVAIATSAGGLAALKEILSNLPADFPLPILVVQHLPERTNAYLADLLARHTPLRVKFAESGERPEPRMVLVAPGGRHLLLQPDLSVCICRQDRVNFVCPSADVLFESIARTYHEAAIAVVLTGMGRDGASGTVAVRRHGGFVIAQDPATAEYASMPAAAIEIGKVDLVLPLHQIASALDTLARSQMAV